MPIFMGAYFVWVIVILILWYIIYYGSVRCGSERYFRLGMNTFMSMPSIYVGGSVMDVMFTL